MKGSRHPWRRRAMQRQNTKGMRGKIAQHRPGGSGAKQYKIMEWFCSFDPNCPSRPGFVGSVFSRRASLVRSKPSPSWSAWRPPKKPGGQGNFARPNVASNKFAPINNKPPPNQRTRDSKSGIKHGNT